MYHDTDLIVKKVWLSMLSDFKTVFGNDFLCREQAAFIEGIPEFRDVSFREYGIVDPYKYKAKYQMESLLKKYRFRKDKYTDEELRDRTNDSYLDHQVALSAHRFTGVLTDRVLRKTRSIILNILGRKLDLEEVFSHVRFGRKSSIGCTLKNAYLDWKVSQSAAITSSSQGGEFFRRYLEGDSILKRLLPDQADFNWSDPKFHCDSLSLVNVPKSWKIHRSITPLTLFDLFLSYGLGGVVQSRLDTEGLNIATLQQRHRRLVKTMSCEDNLRLATADLSRASDSISKTLLMRILPREWWVAIRKLLLTSIEVDGVECYTDSVLPMGNGLTFPLQTLIFYAFLKALSSLTGVRGLVSVYGDDLIYPRKLHKYVARLFPKLGFKLNMEKTYASYPFRESCGSDFYRGVDVRPAFVGGSHQQLRSPQYCSFLYKLYNTLQERWDNVELPTTFALLKAEIAGTSGTVFFVPPSFPHSAGIKCSCPPKGDSNIKILFVRSRGSYAIQFTHLAEVTRTLRPVLCTEIYYWNKLRDRLDDLDASIDYSYRGSGPALSYHAHIVTDTVSPILWRKLRTSSRFSKYDKFKMHPFTYDRNKLDIIHQKATVTDWA